ncbi:hypothetical protein N8K70_03855 [Microbacterium betulae]|uniref:Uncharacterized protein n=1 Tax=Microbacterium betulae TaxID=2981139 RepID=A0AA97FK73_9MICO|nr:hypothetical protein [Microbacterium sp. AB]WOF23825.1 hypothetical protein N8K70_03855 [Microbacterium sp. AB]
MSSHGAEVGVDWANGLVLHESDTEWHPWDPAIYEEKTDEHHE